MAMKGFLEPLVADMISDDLFDSIDDLLDFPNEEDDGLAMAESWGNGAPLAPAPAQPMIPAGCGGGDSVGSAPRGIDARSIAVSGDVISSEADALCLYDEIDTANLEWLSNFFEDSDINVEIIGAAASPDPKPRSSSPISVLHLAAGAGTGAVTSSSSPCSSSSSSSSSGHPTMSPPLHPANIPVPARARTKRPRLPSFSARIFVPPSFSVSAPCPAAGKKSKKDAEPAPSSPRRCAHCDVQKTPQWRAGPTGPKTLCNACGVRYKSGRLFPEYRPAVSPTFLPAVHSNSHRKVVEMRLRCTETAAAKSGRGQIPAGTVAAKNCDLLEYIRRRD
ncbi:GATA transcription factor 8 [Platanthera zijinensis]|uniref:GATA transcription factor 8 n=1 Tax=Platanthera zijinensis TaxID=2320716 RepID=A0AAP0BPZ8_9ASPA